MASEFTLFPHLITELRLEIWRLALPKPLSRALYPYKMGCWVLEELGLEPDPNGEDLHLRFDTSLLEPLYIEIPLYAVNHEARSVAIKYLRRQKLLAPPGSAQSGFRFLRPFDPDIDTMFLPTSDVDDFAVELPERMHEPDLLNRHVSISCHALPRLAITRSGLESLMGDALETFFDFSGTIDSLYVVDVACDGKFTLHDIEDASSFTFLELEQTPYARLLWTSSQREWQEVSGDDKALAQAKQLVTGLDDPPSSTHEFDLEIQLIHLSTPA